MAQREWVDELHRLCHEHPEAEIHVLAASDELVPDNEYRWTAHEIRRVELGLWVFDDEKFFIDPDEYYEHLTDFLELKYSYEQAAAKMRPAILIYTGA